MGLGPMRPMTDWEAMMSARSRLSDEEYDTLCKHWENGVLDTWQVASEAKRALPPKVFSNWMDSLEETAIDINKGRELPQPPHWLL